MYEQYERNGLTIKIHYDNNPESPREWDNVGTMICSHKGYTLGDEQFRPDEYDGWDDLKAHLLTERNAVVIFPLYLYDHSGISMYIPGDGGYRQHEEWDSGQVGFIYCTQEDIDREWGGDKEKAEEYLRGEVKTYDQYLRGDVYGFTIEDKWENPIDSCWGFYGVEDAKEEAESVADAYEQPQEVKIHYSAFKNLFKLLDINPAEFRKLSGGKVVGTFPNMPDRKGPVNVKALASVLWGKGN